ncbi:Cytochrome P450 E-class CYP52 [Penicillium malachiteum]|uniref:Cytochrome P450 E-class CYP52 n=1 Tax=Penicillium malachiteum TaxID=1324776 RepID=A0AAD6MVT5_9EURO|nr:Cytochrome P450 E-class CYP52 [Penicillium malachiteum]
MLLSPTVVLVGGSFLTYLFVSYLLQLHHHRKQAKAWHCEPCPSGSKGLFGIPAFLSLSKAVREKRWIDHISDLYGVHGTTFKNTIFGRAMVSTIEPENVKAILATQFHDFSLGTRHEQFDPLLGDGIFTLDGAGWSHARGLLRLQFTRDQVADLALLDDHITHLINLIPKDRTAFDIQRLFFLLTLDSATHFLFGESVGCMLPESETTGVLAKSAVRNAQGFADAFTIAQDYLASRSRAQGLYWLVNPKEFQDANRKVHEVVDHYVNVALQKKRDPERKDSSRYIFLDALAADTDNPKILRDNMLNILLAGRDTTASLLSSVFYYLGRNKQAWSRLRREIVAIFGDSSNPHTEITQTKLKDIPYLRYVLNETLRLQPPVPVNFRVATKDTTLPVGGGADGKSPIYIQKGTMCAYSVFAMHRRTDFWGQDARSFRPERWEENAKHGWEYLPFNGGPRICLGQQYALTEASYTVIRLMQHFDTLENADLNIREEPVKLSNLTMMHDEGVSVRLYSSEKI